jgi:putative PIN family toxin of toxin-antitoxin system
MRIVLDTNVFISGVFFSGPPYQILDAWRDGRAQLLVSSEIMLEYQQVGERLAKQFPGVELGPILNLLTYTAEIISAPDLPEKVCSDSDDDKFLSCAVAGNANCIVSGDKHLLDVSGYRGVKVVRPRMFLDEYLKGDRG